MAAAVGGQAQARSDLDQGIRQLSAAGGEAAELAQALQRILASERDPEALCQRLSFQFAPVVEAILEALADPAALESILADAAPE